MRIQLIALACLAASVSQAADIRESRQTDASKDARAGEPEFHTLY